MPFSSHNFENSSKVNSPPRSVPKHLINAQLNSLSASVLNFLKAQNAFDLFFKIATHINLKKYQPLTKNTSLC